MPENRIRISCPECRTFYRVDPYAIPEQDGSAMCTDCGRKFSIRKTPSGAIETGAWIPPVETERPDPLPFTCPSCGHRQSQPFNCYKCGAVITPREPTPNVSAPSASMNDPKADDPRTTLNRVMGEIIVRTRFNPSNWPLRLAKPRVSIDGMEHEKEWGVHVFHAPYGDSAVIVDCKFLWSHRGRGEIQIHVVQNEKTYVDYYAESLSAPGKLRKAALAEGLLWTIHAGIDRPPVKNSASRKAVITSLFLLGPLGLFKLWKSDQFSSVAKMAVTAVVVLITLWLISKLSIPTGMTLPGF